MKKLVFLFLALLLCPFLFSQDFSVKVWPNGAPNSNGLIQPEEKYDGRRVRFVSAKTPPAFFILADDDKSVIPQNSIDFYLALKKYNIPAEMHIFRKGGHGFGIRKNNIPADNWPNLFYDWLKAMEIIK